MTVIQNSYLSIRYTHQPMRVDTVDMHVDYL
jgi:hypothetical protein